jgi:hypothetical protein
MLNKANENPKPLCLKRNKVANPIKKKIDMGMVLYVPGNCHVNAASPIVRPMNKGKKIELNNPAMNVAPVAEIEGKVHHNATSVEPHALINLRI